MKSSFLEKSKRALVLLLTGAMIATSVPSTAFAATVADDDVIIEEATDAVAEDAVVEEEVVADEPSEAVEALGAEEVVEDADTVEADDAAYDKVITIGEESTIGTTAGTPTALSDYQYGVTHADVTITAKATANDVTSTFTGAKIELYRVKGTEALGTNATALKTTVDTFNTAKAAYELDRNVAANKTAYDNAKTALDTDIAKYATLVADSTDAATKSGTISNGLDYSIADGVLTFGVPTAMHSVFHGYYVAKISDPDNSENLPVCTTVFNIESIGIYNDETPSNDAYQDVHFNIASSANGNAKSTDTTTPKKLDGSASAYNGSGEDISLITFRTANMGYGVFDTLAKATEAGKAADADNIIGHPITISSDLLAAKGTSSTVNDLSFTFTDINGEPLATPLFEVVKNPESGALSTGSDLTAIVKPVEGLAAKNSVPTNYIAYLHVSSESSFTTEYIAELAITVLPNISLSYKIGTGAEATITGATKGILDNASANDLGKLNPTYVSNLTPSGKNALAAGTEGNPYVLTNKNVGTAFNDVVVTAKGGTNIVLKAAGTGAENLGSDGLEGVWDNSTKNLVISGALKQTAYADYADAQTDAAADTTSTANVAYIGLIKAHSFAVTATDKDNNNTVTKYFIVLPDVVESKNISFTVGDQKLKYGDSTATPIAQNTYSWNAAKGTTDVTKSTKTLTITNNTAVELTLADRVVDNTSAGLGGAFTWTPVGNAEVKIAAGASQDFVIAPVKNADSVNQVTNDLTVGGWALSDTKVRFDFSVAAADLKITTPAADNTIITSGEVGLEYDGYQLDAVTVTGATKTTWEITGAAFADGETNKFTGALGGTATESGTWTTVADDKLEEFITESGLTLSAAGKLTGTPAKAQDIKWTVKATAITSSEQTETVNVYMHVAKPTVKSAIAVTSDTTNISADKALALADVAVDTATPSSATVNVANLTGNKFTGVTATIVGDVTRTNSKSNSTSLTAGTYFDLVFDEADATQNAYLKANGMTIDKNPAVGSFKIVSKPGADMIAGDYSFKVRITSSDFVSGDNGKLDFDVTLKVTSTPLLVAHGKLLTGLTAGAANDAAAATEYFSVIDGTDGVTPSKLDWNFAVADVTGSDMTIEQSALTFDTTSSNKSVGVSGTPKKAGTLKVSVTATAKSDATITTTKVFNIEIKGSVELTAKINGSIVGSQKTLSVVDGKKVYVLPGLIEGKDNSTTTLDISNEVAAAGTGLTITVTDAPDDRAGDVKEAAGGVNVYEGSSSVITVTAPANTTIAASNGTASAVINASAAKAGTYKVKITVGGENIKPFSFFVYLVVSKPIDITVPTNPVAEVGAKTHFELEATGIDGLITLAEVENAKGDALTSPSRLVTTGAGFGAATSVNSSVAVDPKYGGATVYYNSFVISGSAPSTVSKKDESNLITGLEIKDYKDGAPANKGTFTAYVKGTYAGSSIPNGSGKITGHFGGADGTTAEAVGDWINYDGTGANAPIAAQNKVVTFAFTVNATKGVKIENVTSDQNVANTAATKYDYTEGMTDADISGIVSSEVRAYTLKEAAVGDTPAPIYVGIANTTASNISGASLTIDKSKFIPATGDKTESDVAGGVKNAAVTGSGTEVSPYAITTLFADRDNYIKIIPAAVDGSGKLKKGTYEDTITITSVNLEKTLTIKLTLVVTDKTYLIDAEYIADAGAALDTGLTIGTMAAERAAAPSYTVYKDNEDLTTIATKSVLESGAKIELTPFIKGSAASVDDVLFFRNTGNAAIDANAVEISEVDKDGNPITSTSKYLLKTRVAAYDPATADEIQLGALAKEEADTDYHETYISIKPNKETDLEAGEYDAFLKVSIKDATPASFIVPVHFVVFDKDITTVSHTPSDEVLTLKSVEEGYASTDATGGEFTVTNTASAATSTLYDLSITISGSDAGAFMIASDDDNVDSFNGKISKIEPGKSVSFKVVPVEGLPAKTYKAAVTISGGNLATSAAIQKSLSLAITESKSFSIDSYSTGSAITGNASASFAQRLWNTFASAKGLTYVAKAIDADAKASTAADKGVMPTIADGVKVYVDLDGNEVYDTTLKFGVSGGTAVSNITGVQVYRSTAAGKDIALPNGSYTLTGFSYDDNTKYFTTVTINQYSVITFGAEKGKEYINAPFATYESDNENVWIVGDKSTEDGVLKGLITGNSSNKALVAIVQNGSIAASSFTAGLPTVLYVDGSEAFEGWQTSTTRKTVDASTYVTCDDTYVAVWHGHEYPGSTEGDTANIKWSWSEDHKQATVTISCVKSNCPASDKGAITLDSTKGDIIITDSKKDANCTEGERHEFKAETVAAKMPNGAVYTSIVKTDEDKSTVLGHQYATTITWEKQADKTYAPTITQTCIRTGCEDKDGKKNYTVPVSAIVVNEEVKQAATCTEAGRSVYTIKSFTDGNGKTVSEEDVKKIENYSYDAVIDAKGHTWEVTECKLDAKTASFKCKECELTFTGDVTVTENADGSYTVTAVSDNSITGTYFDHTHKWSAPEWTWSGFASATAKFTCTTGKETKELTATITPTGKTNTKGSQYKATVTGPDGNAYEDLKWFDASGNPTSGEGIGIEGLETEYEYTGKQIKPAFTVVDYSIDKTLALGVDYTVKYGKNVDAGENAGSVTITGKGNYDKQGVSETFTIVDPFKDEVKDNYIDNVASITLPKATYFYDGTPKMPATITIKSKAKPAEVITATLNEAGDGYEFGSDSKEAYISVSNNINKGSATVSVRGKNDTKAKIKTFPIKALDLTTVTAEDLTFDPDDAVYAVKGAIPANLNVEYKGTPLVLGQDYTVKYSYTSKTKDAGDDAGSFKITGKGNFAKTFGTAQTFNIVPLSLEDDAVSVAAYDKANGAKLQAIVADGNGVKIPAKQLVVTSSKTAKLVAGDEIEVTVKGANDKNISGEVTLNIKVAENLKTAKVAIAKGYAVQYTGEAINLEDLEKNPFEDGTITVTAKKAGKLEYGTDFEIAGYVNNVKKGTMTVVIRGIGEKVSGNKEVKIKITPKAVKKAE